MNLFKAIRTNRKYYKDAKKRVTSYLNDDNIVELAKCVTSFCFSTNYVSALHINGTISDEEMLRLNKAVTYHVYTLLLLMRGNAWSLIDRIISIFKIREKNWGVILPIDLEWLLDTGLTDEDVFKCFRDTD